MPPLLNETTNPVADLRRSLIKNGYNPIPVDGKRPRVPGWQDLQPDASKVDALIHQYSDHTNTGILTGALVAIDVDVLDPALARTIATLVAALPGAENALCRVGRAPKSLFIFRTNTPAKKRVTPKYLVGGETAQVEILGVGQQFVGFGQHPDTLTDYEWVGDSPIDVSFDDLPVIASDTIDKFLADAEAALASAGEPVRAAKTKLPMSEPSSGSTPWEKVNSVALSNLDAWVPQLGLQGLKRYLAGYLAVASFRPSKRAGLAESARQAALEFQVEGICDHGDDDKGYSPVSMAGLCLGIRPSDALPWLCDALGIQPHTIGWETAHTSAPRVISKLAGTLVAANDNEPPEAPFAVPVASSAGMPEHLCFPPGAVGEFSSWIVSCARFPSPHLALAASLAFTAALVGRRYRGPTGLRSNLYVVGLAESGFGKDITIRATAALADSTPKGADVSKHIFMDEVRSVPGLAAALRRSPSSVTVIDEFGKFLGQHTGPRVAAHREEIATAIMALTGAPAGYWGGQEKGAGNIARIVQPCFSIHGVSTPSTFWAALSSGNISEGLLGRLVLIEAAGSEPKKVRKPEGSIEAIPPDLAARVHSLLGGGNGKWHGGPFYALDAKSDETPWPMITAMFDDGVEDIFEDFDDAMRAKKSTVSPEYRPILNRVGENAARLALIVAVGVDHKDPVITAEIQEWANAVAEHSFSTMIRGADANIADNEKSAEYLRVRQIVAKRGVDGVTLKIITRQIRGALDSKRLDDILKALRQGHEIHFARHRTDSGQTMTRFWLAENLPEGAEIIPVG